MSLFTKAIAYSKEKVFLLTEKINTVLGNFYGLECRSSLAICPKTMIAFCEHGHEECGKLPATSFSVSV